MDPRPWTSHSWAGVARNGPYVLATSTLDGSGYAVKGFSRRRQLSPSLLICSTARSWDASLLVVSRRPCRHVREPAKKRAYVGTWTKQGHDLQDCYMLLPPVCFRWQKKMRCQSNISWRLSFRSWPVDDTHIVTVVVRLSHSQRRNKQRRKHMSFSQLHCGQNLVPRVFVARVRQTTARAAKSSKTPSTTRT
jgi:hypothetical protein